MTKHLYVVCETDGDCQEEAVATVSVLYPRSGVPYFTKRVCEHHAMATLEVYGKGRKWSVLIDQGVQGSLF